MLTKPLLEKKKRNLEKIGEKAAVKQHLKFLVKIFSFKFFKEKG